MTYSRLSFGEMTTTGELARGWEPADEVELQIALALGRPDPASHPPPPFAVVPVLLDGYEIGRIEKIVYVGSQEHAAYKFTSTSGNTSFSSSDRDGVVQMLAEVLQLAG